MAVERVRHAIDVGRKAVSSDRVRFRHHKGFHLDLTYITLDLIAMSMPAKRGTLTSLWRNSSTDVNRFLKRRHGDKFMIWRLNDQENYDYDSFDDTVLDYAFPDHTPPPLDWLCEIVISIARFLSVSQHADASESRPVAAVHCKGGKGRTGVIISAYLLFKYPQAFSSWQDAQGHFAQRRSHSGTGVTGPSQLRYIEYFQDILTATYSHSEMSPSHRRRDLRTRMLRPTAVSVRSSCGALTAEIFEVRPGAAFSPTSIGALSLVNINAGVCRGTISQPLRAAVDWKIAVRTLDGDELFVAFVHPLFCDWVPTARVPIEHGEIRLSSAELDPPPRSPFALTAPKLPMDIEVSIEIESKLVNDSPPNRLWQDLRDAWMAECKVPTSDYSMLENLPTNEQLQVEGSAKHVDSSSLASAIEALDDVSGTEDLALLNTKGRVARFEAEAKVRLRSIGENSTRFESDLGSSLKLILFSTILLWAPSANRLRRSFNGKPFQLREAWNLERCSGVACGKDRDLSVVAQGPHQSLTVQFESNEERDRWYELLWSMIAEAKRYEAVMLQRAAMVNLEEEKLEPDRSLTLASPQRAAAILAEYPSNKNEREGPLFSLDHTAPPMTSSVISHSVPVSAPLVSGDLISFD